MDIKEQIKQYISIVEVASQYVNLKPAGKNLKALCPFHTEKTPSFFVMPDRNTFSCYGCNRFGDIFTLVQEMENLDFRQAMDFLIERFHIPVQKPQKREPRKDEYLQINRIALDYFRSNLGDGAEGRKAREYLLRRGIDKATCGTFALGYASDSWDGLYGYLQNQGVALDKAVELGLLVRSEKNRIYDRFRGRIIFPIFSETGVALGFGGRTMGNDEPKYLNSPESPIYKKGYHLYGFHLAKETIRQKKAAVLVEGYLDMIALFQAGITNAVASLGTALTENQIYLLKRFAEDIYLFYDSDAAGVQATLRALEKMLEQGINPFILQDVEVKDPDEFIQKKGVQAFAALSSGAADGFRYLLLHSAAASDLTRPEKKRLAIEAVMTVVRRIGDPILRDEYTLRTADFFKVDPTLLRGGTAAPAAVAAGGSLRVGTDEREFLLALIAYPDIIVEIKEFCGEELYSVLAARNILQAMIGTFRQGREFAVEDIARQCSDAEKALLNQLFRAREEKPVLAAAVKTVEACMLNFIKKINKRKSSRLTQEIAVLERENKLAQAKKLLQEKSRFKKDLDKQM